jgi:uncharacterized membrane protein
MCYFYISEILGSISTTYILDEGYKIQFNGTLLLFTFLAVLAGPIHGFVAGFLAELLVQIAFFNAIYIEWCYIVAVIGLFCGFYRYKPLKYHEGMKVYYTFLIMVIVSFFVMFMILIFQLTLNRSDFINSFINYGFKFFLQALISIVFPIPILLIIYDKVFATQERHIYNLFFTHHPISASDHTFYLEFGRTRFYFCSRCSGIVIGILISTFLTHVGEIISGAILSPELALMLCILLPIIGIIDWGTQRLKYRKSTTKSRLFTGFLIGVALHFISYTRQYYFFMLIVISIYFAIFFLLVFLGNKKEMKKFREEMDQLSSEEAELI